MVATLAAGSLLLAGAQRYDIEVSRMHTWFALNGILTPGPLKVPSFLRKTVFGREPAASAARL